MDVPQAMGPCARECMSLDYRPGTEHDVFVTAVFYCSLSPDKSPEARPEGRLIHVEVPANEREQQKLREAMELFTMLAAVNNKVFKTLTAKYMKVAAFAEEQIVLFPAWLLKLKGKLPSKDPVTTQAAVTWGELFGCPKDTRDYSEKFREAMAKLETMGLEGQRWLYQSVQYRLDYSRVFRGFELSGNQRTIVSEAEQDAPATTEQFASHLSKFFRFKAPPAVQLCAVDDTATLVEAWGRMPRTVSDELVIDKMRYLISTYFNLDRASLSVQEVAAALARHTYPTVVKIQLHFAGERVEGISMVNFGFLIAGLVCGRALCMPMGERYEFSIMNQGKGRRLELLFDCALGAKFVAISSAITEASELERLSIGRWITHNETVNPTHHVYWGWLTFAVWGESSRFSAQKLTIRGMELDQLGVAAFKTALTENYPEPESQSSHNVQYGYVDLQAGTQLHTRGLVEIDDTEFLLLQSTL